MNAAGHAKADMSQEYTLVDLSAQEKAVREFQDRVLGEPVVKNPTSIRPE